MKKLLFQYLLISCYCMITACSPDTIHDDSEPETAAAGDLQTPEANLVTISANQFQTAGIEMGKLEKRKFGNAIRVNGVVDVPPQNFASVSAHLGGFVKSANILPGNYIKKGKILAIMEHPDYITLQQDYLQALGKFIFLEKDLARQQELVAENVGAAKNLQQAESEFAITKAQLSALEAKLQMLGISLEKLRKGTISPYITIVSPINGYVKSANVNIGKYMGPMDVMFEIVDKEHLHLELKVFEKDVAKIKKGQKIFFQASNMGAKEFPAEIYLIGQVFEGESKSINVHAHLEEEQQQSLIPGMFVTARILTNESMENSLPEEAVSTAGNLHYVFVAAGKNAQNYQFQRIQVNTRETENGFTEVDLLQPLPEGTQIVTKGTYYLAAAMNNVAED